jgi:hypothetical protein
VVPEDEKGVSPFAPGAHFSRFYRCDLAGGNFFPLSRPDSQLRRSIFPISNRCRTVLPNHARQREKVLTVSNRPDYVAVALH